MFEGLDPQRIPFAMFYGLNIVVSTMLSSAFQASGDPEGQAKVFREAVTRSIANLRLDEFEGAEREAFRNAMQDVVGDMVSMAEKARAG